MEDSFYLLDNLVCQLRDPNETIRGASRDALFLAYTKNTLPFINFLRHVFSNEALYDGNLEEIFHLILEMISNYYVPELCGGLGAAILKICFEGCSCCNESVHDMSLEILCEFVENDPLLLLEQLNVRMPLSCDSMKFVNIVAERKISAYFFTKTGVSKVMRDLAEQLWMISDEATMVAFSDFIANVAEMASDFRSQAVGTFTDIFRDMIKMWYPKSSDPCKATLCIALGNMAPFVLLDVVVENMAVCMSIMDVAMKVSQRKQKVVEGLYMFLSVIIKRKNEFSIAAPHDLVMNNLKFVEDGFGEEKRNMKALEMAVHNVVLLVEMFTNRFAPLAVHGNIEPCLFIYRIVSAEFWSTDYMTSVIEGVAQIDESTLDARQKAVFNGCILTLIHRAIVVNDNIKSLATKLLRDIANREEDAADCALSLLSSVRTVDKCHPIMLPVILNVIMNPVYYGALDTMIECLGEMLADASDWKKEILAKIGKSSLSMKALMMVAKFGCLVEERMFEYVDVFYKHLPDGPEPTFEDISSLKKSYKLTNPQDVHQFHSACFVTYAHFLGKSDPDEAEWRKLVSHEIDHHDLEQPEGMTQMANIFRELSYSSVHYCLGFIVEQAKARSEQSPWKFWTWAKKILPINAVYSIAAAVLDAKVSGPDYHTLFELLTSKLMDDGELRPCYRDEFLASVLVSDLIEIEDPTEFIDIICTDVEKGGDLSYLRSLARVYEARPDDLPSIANIINSVFNSYQPSRELFTTLALIIEPYFRHDYYPSMDILIRFNTLAEEFVFQDQALLDVVATVCAPLAQKGNSFRTGALIHMYTFYFVLFMGGVEKAGQIADIIGSVIGFAHDENECSYDAIAGILLKGDSPFNAYRFLLSLMTRGKRFREVVLALMRAMTNFKQLKYNTQVLTRECYRICDEVEVFSILYAASPSVVLEELVSSTPSPLLDRILRHLLVKHYDFSFHFMTHPVTLLSLEVLCKNVDLIRKQDVERLYVRLAVFCHGTMGLEKQVAALMTQIVPLVYRRMVTEERLTDKRHDLHMYLSICDGFVQRKQGADARIFEQCENDSTNSEINMLVFGSILRYSHNTQLCEQSLENLMQITATGHQEKLRLRMIARISMSAIRSKSELVGKVIDHICSLGNTKDTISALSKIAIGVDTPMLTSYSDKLIQRIEHAILDDAPELCGYALKVLKELYLTERGPEICQKTIIIPLMFLFSDHRPSAIPCVDYIAKTLHLSPMLSRETDITRFIRIHADSLQPFLPDMKTITDYARANEDSAKIFILQLIGATKSLSDTMRLSAFLNYCVTVGSNDVKITALHVLSKLAH